MKPHDLHTSHREAQEALPWLANGTLLGAELERVQAHVRGCAACRTGLAQLHTLRSAGQGAALDLDPDAAFARLLPQLDVQEPLPTSTPLPAAPGWRARLAANDRSWLRAAVAIQCCAIAVLAGLLLRPSTTPDAQAGDYRVLGAAPGAQAGLIVTFKPDTPEHELRRIVRAIGARIVGGPTATGAWMLGAEGDARQVVAHLRTEPAVTLAEPLGAERAP